MVYSHNVVNGLRAIKGRLVDPMQNLMNWNRGDPCRSNWTGVFCHKVNDDTFLHVTELYDQHFYFICSSYFVFFYPFVLVTMLLLLNKNQQSLLLSKVVFTVKCQLHPTPQGNFFPAFTHKSNCNMNCLGWQLSNHKNMKHQSCELYQTKFTNPSTIALCLLF